MVIDTPGEGFMSTHTWRNLVLDFTSVSQRVAIVLLLVRPRLTDNDLKIITFLVRNGIRFQVSAIVP